MDSRLYIALYGMILSERVAGFVCYISAGLKGLCYAFMLVAKLPGALGVFGLVMNTGMIL